MAQRITRVRALAPGAVQLSEQSHRATRVVASEAQAERESNAGRAARRGADGENNQIAVAAETG